MKFVLADWKKQREPIQCSKLPFFSDMLDEDTSNISLNVDVSTYIL